MTGGLPLDSSSSPCPPLADDPAGDCQVDPRLLGNPSRQRESPGQSPHGSRPFGSTRSEPLPGRRRTTCGPTPRYPNCPDWPPGTGCRRLRSLLPGSGEPPANLPPPLCQAGHRSSSMEIKVNERSADRAHVQGSGAGSDTGTSSGSRCESNRDLPPEGPCCMRIRSAIGPAPVAGGRSWRAADRLGDH